MGGVVEAVFVRTCRGRRKDSSTAPASETSTTTASPHSSLKSSAWSSEGSERPESNAQQRFRSAQELERAKKKAQQKKKEARIAQEKIAMGIIEQPPASPAGDLKPARKIIDTSKLTKAERMALEQAAMSGVGSNFSMGDEGAGTGTGGTT